MTKALFYRNVPNVIFISSEQEEIKENYNLESNYKFITINDNFWSSFVTSRQGKTADDKLKELLHAHTLCSQQVSLNLIPLYHLQPNSRILIQDEKTNINGEYLITKISLSLGYSEKASITAEKIIEKIY